jgi:hypothetical protein
MEYTGKTYRILKSIPEYTFYGYNPQDVYASRKKISPGIFSMFTVGKTVYTGDLLTYNVGFLDFVDYGGPVVVKAVDLNNLISAGILKEVAVEFTCPRETKVEFAPSRLSEIE